MSIHIPNDKIAKSFQKCRSPRHGEAVVIVQNEVISRVTSFMVAEYVRKRQPDPNSLEARLWSLRCLSAYYAVLDVKRQLLGRVGQ